MESTDFSWALRRARAGGRIFRTGWNGHGMWVELQVPDAHSKMGCPYLYIKTVDGKLCPWVASQTDLLANDWDII